MKISKIDALGCILETVDLDKCFENKTPSRYLMEIDDKIYIIAYHSIDEVNVNLEKIQKNCLDNI